MSQGCKRSSKQQLGVPDQTWQQYYIHGRMVNLYRVTLGEKNFIERIKVPIFLEAVLVITKM